MLAPAIELEGMVGDGAEHVGSCANTAGILDKSSCKNRSKQRDYFHITSAVGQPVTAKCIEEAPNCPRYCLPLKFSSIELC